MWAADWINHAVDRAAVSRRLYALTGIGRRRHARDGGAVPPMPAAAYGETLAEGAMARVRFNAIDQLLGEAGRARIGRLVSQCAAGWPFAAELLPPQALASTLPDIYLLGLSPPLLAAVHAYLEEPCLYLGAMMKVERVAPGGGTRRWHFDVEDLRMLRVLVYLNDVSPDDGPLEVLPEALSRAARKALAYRTGYVADEAMAAVVPPEQWVCCPADAGDALFFDGTNLFHRARPPTVRERMSITFSYTTRRPVQVYRGARLLERTQKELMALLSPEQQTCFPRARLF